MSFYEYDLRVGDLLYSEREVIFLTKKTRSYWYYYMKGFQARIGKQRLWSLVDSRKLSIGYSSDMKYRRKNKRGRTLDLHGVKHAEVPEVLMRFLNFVELPCKIITGDSEEMIEIVKKIIKTYDWRCYNDLVNRGVLHVDTKE